MSNYSGTLPWYPSVPAVSLPAWNPGALEDADVGRLIRRRSLGIFFFWVLTFLAINNLNGLSIMALGYSRLFSYPMLACVVGALIVFQFALLRDMGVSGLLYVVFLSTYLLISLPINFMPGPMDVPSRIMVLQMDLTSLVVIAACAQGARHVMLAWSKRRMMFWLYIITLVQVAMIFVGMLFPGYVYGVTGPLVEGRFSGFFRNPNEAGFASAACVAVGFAYLTVARYKFWVLGGILLSALATVLTFSRSSFVTMLLLILMQILISPVIKRKSILVGILVAGGFLTWFATVGVFSFMDLNYTQTKRAASLQRILTFQVDLEEDTGSRITGAQFAIKHWLESPMIGKGFTTMRRMPETGLGPHNQYLLVLAEGGILPLATMLLFLFVFIGTAWRTKDRTVRSLGLGIGFVFAAACMVNHTVINSRSHAALIGICMGLFAAVNYRNRVLRGAATAAGMAYPTTGRPVGTGRA